jgi:hypothetical protein
MRQANTIRYLIAFVAAVLGALMLYVCLFTGIPPRESLVSASGTVEWVETRGARRHSDEVHFGLVGEQKIFTYLQKAGSKNDVLKALRREGAKVSILFDPEDAHMGSHIIYEIADPVVTIRSYDEVQSSWEVNHSIGVWFGAFFLLLSVLLAFKPLVDKHLDTINTPKGASE